MDLSANPDSPLSGGGSGGGSSSITSSLSVGRSRYDAQKRRDWNTFGHYFRNHRPLLSLAQCSGAHVLEFLRYVDQFGKTKVHAAACPFFGHPSPPAPCPCPFRQAWGSLNALVDRLRVAYLEHGGSQELNPFAARGVQLYLREVREHQARARGISYETEKRKPPQEQLTAGDSSSGFRSNHHQPPPPPQMAIPSRVMVIGEGEIQRLKKHLNELSTSTANLEKQLEGLCSPLVELSEKEDPSLTARCWMKQVRELCHDTGDYLRDFMNSNREFDMLGARARNASERLESYGLRPKTPSMTMVRRLPAPHADLIHHVHNDMVDKVKLLMGTDKELRVVSIVGPEGVGKTTLAKELYRHCIGRSGELHCWAFLRVSAKPDIPRLLTSIFTQILRKQPSRRLDAHGLIEITARYLQNKRYFIIIDDLWTADVWDIISRAFPDGDCCSRIITTTQFLDVAMTCCGHQSKYLFKMLPLSDVQSRKLFFRIVFGFESDYPRNLIEVSDGIIRKCGGLPLATINIASMLPSTANLQEWTGIRDSLPSTWNTNLSSEWMKEVVNLMFITLRPHLKTSLLYFTMYPVGWIARKDDLVKQWVVEGFLDGVRGQETEEIAGGYFDELVRRGMIQPVDTDKNGKVLSCTLHHTIHHIIVNKSMEENFVVVVDYFQSSIALPDKVRRLSVQFGGARSAYIPESIMVSEIRSLAFFGFLQCLPSITQNSLLRVLILHILADQDKDCIDLAGIRELHLLRYLKIACNVGVKLPDEIQGQQYLEVLEVNATLAAIPWDIGELSKLRILKIAVTKLSNRDIYSLQILPALSALSVHVKTAPSKLFFFGKGGFSVLKFFTFRCSAPRLVIKENAMPKIEKVNICFKANEARQAGKKPITIRHLPSLLEISAKIWGTVADAGSAVADAVTNHPRNPIPIVQLMESREDQEHGTLEEQDEIMEEDASKDADSGICMLPGTSSSRLPVPDPLTVAAVGWGVATAGWILSPIFIRLVDKALSHMEPGESKDNLSKLVAHMIPRLKLTVEVAESSEDKVFFEKLVRELKSNFYELEEILDEVEYDRLERQLAHDGPANQEIAIQSRLKVPESVKDRLTKNMNNIEQALEEARDNINLEKLPSNRSTQRRLEVKDRHKITSRKPRVQLIGRDKDLKNISYLLHLVGRSRGQTSVIGIYGIAGSGKTTLAQHVYQSEKKENHFDLFMWIHVSRNFGVGEIFCEMLQQVTGNIDESTRKDCLDEIRAKLKEELRGRNFLLVLDDIWCDGDSDKYKLYELFSLLTKDVPEQSKILVTSRNKNAISAMGHDVEGTTIEIQDMSEKDFFNLFLNHALRGDMIDVRVKESLEGIGAHIVKRLNGSPLAAALVGGLLRKEMTVDHWISVKDDPYLLKGIMGILWLCYQHLDDQARRCFAYCSIFLRKHRFERDELVNLWVAEGFIEATDAGQMEEIGKDIFGELVSSSFMHLGEKDCNGGKEYFLVHDLLHDIAEQVGGNDIFRIIEDGWRGEIPLDVRHLFVQISYRFLMKDVIKLEKLRSLIILTGVNSLANELFEDILGNKTRLRKLRVLVIKTTYTDSREKYSYSFPASMGDLKHMRYVAFLSRFIYTMELPAAFTKLYHMQVLDFGACRDLSIDRGMMPINVRHLIVGGKVRGIGRLTSLKNLPFFRISICVGYGFYQLKERHKLRGKLHIVGLELLESKYEALEAKLADKEGLRELVLEWGYLFHEETRVTLKKEANVLEGLCPSEHLEELEIIKYHGGRYPDWMVGDQQRSWRVQRLVIKECSPLGVIPKSSPFFSNLLRLTFQYCEWDALPDYMEHLVKLTVLIIDKCKQMKSLGELPQSLKYLEIHRCGSDLTAFCKLDPKWKKTKKIERIFIGYPRLQDSSQYPDEHGVFSPDATLPKKDRDDDMEEKNEEDRDDEEDSDEITTPQNLDLRH